MVTPTGKKKDGALQNQVRKSSTREALSLEEEGYISSKSFASSQISETSYRGVTWQVLKEFDDGSHEWRNYTDDEKRRIEKGFQRGTTCVRLTGCTEQEEGSPRKGQLKELFLGDMVEYNPLSGKVNKIRRLGPDSMLSKASREIHGYLESVATGKQRHKSFIKYRQMMSGTSKQQTIKPPRSEFCARIVAAGIFIVVQTLAIILNTVVIGFDVEYNTPHASDETQAVFQVIDHSFCAFFTAEILLRFGAMKKAKDSSKAIKKILKDRWFCFDFILVLLMILETWVMGLFFSGGAGLETSNMSTLRLMRLMRLSRVGRVGRLLKVFPEILMMLKSIAAASRAVFCTLGMLVVMLYVFAILFKAQSEESPLQRMFPTIPTTMWKLLIHGAFMDDLGDTADMIGKDDRGLATLFLAFVLLSNLILLNMLIGVICDVATGISLKEKEVMSVKALTKDLGEFLECFDMDDDQQISLQEFDLLIANPDVRFMLERHEVDVNTLQGLRVSLFSDLDAHTAAKNEQRQGSAFPNVETFSEHWKSLSFQELIETILRFRAGTGNNATMLDIINCERNLLSQIQELEKLVVEIRKPSKQIMTASGETGASAFGSCHSMPLQKSSQEVELMTLGKISKVVKDHQTDPVSQPKSAKTSKVVDDHNGNPEPESKARTISHTNEQQSLKAGIEYGFYAKGIPEEWQVPESGCDKQHSVKAGIEPMVLDKEMSTLSKILEEQQDNLLTKVGEKFAQQQCTFKAFVLEEIQEQIMKQMKSLEVGQREILGQLDGNNMTSRNQLSDYRCPLSAEQAQAAPQACFFEKIPKPHSQPQPQGAPHAEELFRGWANV